MLAQIKQAKPDFNVEILGVNRIGDARYNHYITEEFTLPWLQDTDAAAVWTQWNVEYRDVKILDPQNRIFATFNLTLRDLSLPEHYNALKDLFLSAAAASDADNDLIPDVWQTFYLTPENKSPNADPDSDGADNLTEFALGSHPMNAGSVPRFQIEARPTAGTDVVQCSFLQPAGHLFSYSIETSPDLNSWVPVIRPSAATPKNLFDGTGRWESWFTVDTGLQPQTFFRIRATPRNR